MQIWGSVLPPCGRPLHLACPHSWHCLGYLLSQVTLVIIIIIISIIITSQWILWWPRKGWRSSTMCQLAVEGVERQKFGRLTSSYLRPRWEHSVVKIQRRIGRMLVGNCQKGTDHLMKTLCLRVLIRTSRQKSTSLRARLIATACWVDWSSKWSDGWGRTIYTPQRRQRAEVLSIKKMKTRAAWFQLGGACQRCLSKASHAFRGPEPFKGES